MKANRGLSLERMVKLGRVSRSGFYRFQTAKPSPDRDMDLRDAMQRIALEWPSYGRPRITAELRRQVTSPAGTTAARGRLGPIARGARGRRCGPSSSRWC